MTDYTPDEIAALYALKEAATNAYELACTRRPPREVSRALIPARIHLEDISFDLMTRRLAGE